MSASLRLSAVLALCALAPAASAADYLVYVPVSLGQGGGTLDAYAVRTFQAHDGLAGAALVDASLAELEKHLGEDMKALQVKVSGSSATVTFVQDRREDVRVADTALGAIYYTLRLAGVGEVRALDSVLSEAWFSRGALLPVIPFASALPPRQLSHGYVLLGGRPVEAAEFYRRVAGGDPTIRDAAAETLERGGTVAKIQVLKAMNELRLKDPLALLLPRLEDPDSRVRLAVLEMVRDVRDPKLMKALETLVQGDPDPAAKTEAAKILVTSGRAEFKKYLLLEKLQDRDAGAVIAAANELIATGDRNLAPAMIGLVQHPNPDVRAAGVKALVEFQQHEAMEKALADPKVAKDVAQPLARALADLGTGQSQAAGIRWLLDQGDRLQAIHAATLAAEKRVAGTTAALGRALKREDPGLRRAAAKALGALKDAAGLEPLAEALRGAGDPDEVEVFTQVAITIIAVQPLEQVVRISESPDLTIRELAVKSLAEFAKDRPNPRVVSALRQHLGASQKTIRQAAAYALARVKDDSVVNDLVALKGDADPMIREQVAFAVSASNHPQADAILLAYLDDGDNRVKLQAVRGVRQRKLAAAFEKLRWLTEYRQTDVRREVMQAVLDLAQPADPALFEVYQNRLYDDDARVRLLALEGLAQYSKDTRQAPAVGGAVVDADSRVKLKALEILSGSEDESAVEQVIRGLFDDAKEVKLSALAALEKIGSGKAKKALQEFILNEGDEEVKRRATEVLDKL